MNSNLFNIFLIIYIGGFVCFHVLCLIYAFTVWPPRLQYYWAVIVISVMWPMLGLVMGYAIYRGIIELIKAITNEQKTADRESTIRQGQPKEELSSSPR